MKNKEIELKFKISQEIKKKIIHDLEKQTAKCKEFRLIDIYYVPYFKDFEENGETVECLRVREFNGEIVLTYKKIHKESTPVYCDEFETKIENKQQLEKILFALGFEVQMVIDKTRTTYKLGDYEFDFDDVKGIGNLLEIELKSEEGSVENIYSFVSQYGLSEKDRATEGIQTMMKNAMKKD